MNSHEMITNGKYEPPEGVAQLPRDLIGGDLIQSGGNFQMRTSRSMKSWQKVAALAAIAGLFVAACGGDEEGGTADSAVSEASDTASASDSAAASDSAEASDSASAPASDTVEATQSEGLDSGLGSRAEARRIVFLADYAPSDPFWGTIQTGAQDAAALFNIELDFQFNQTNRGDVNEYNELVGTAAASNPAALAVVVRDPDVLTENICAAAEAGIPVMSYNITQGGDVGACMHGFIGQDFPTAGYLVASEMIKAAGIGEGDLVVLPVEQPDASYAQERAEGVTKALDEVGAVYEIIESGAVDQAEAKEKLTQWLVGHPEVKAIIPMGGTPHSVAVAAVEDAGLSTDQVKIGGFDIGAEVVAGIKSGDILMAVTQEPYIQGFQTIAELALFLDFGIKPFSINTGQGLVTIDNVATVEELAGKTR
jgi:simple sugar transport system substrate-binding protein